MAIYREKIGTHIEISISNPIYEISLNSLNADSSGTSTIYEKYSTGYFLDLNVNNQMTSESNSITIPHKNGLVFDGYYTGINGSGTKYIDEFGYIVDGISDEAFNSNTTLYAYYKSPLCIRAKTLHKKECEKTSDGCYADGYYEGGSKGTNIISYGNNPSTRSTTEVVSGDAFDCDVNNDGIYDPYTERFYYVTDNNSNNAVMMFYRPFYIDSGWDVEYTSLVDAQEEEDDNTLLQTKNIYGPITASKYLPDNSVWKSNKIIAPSEGRITNELGEYATSAGMARSFSYNGKVARLLRYEEVMDACPNGDFSNCIYMFDCDSKYTNDSGNENILLETPASNSADGVYTIDVSAREFKIDTKGVLKPVIEIPKQYLNLDLSLSSVRVTYNANGGTFKNETSTNIVDYYVNSAEITNGQFQIPTKVGSYFNGWRSSKDNQIYKDLYNYVASEDITFTAEWTNELPLLCKRATTLHTETCNTTDYGCSYVGYNLGDTITYGNSIETRINNYVFSGDAFDCDVNNDGIYDSVNERFYYVTDSNDGQNAVLVYYNSKLEKDDYYVNLALEGRYQEIVYSSLEDIQSVDSEVTEVDNIHGPVTAVKYLPTTSAWSNQSIIVPGARQITTGKSTTTTLAGDITSFNYQVNGVATAARLLTLQEVEKACDKDGYVYGQNKNLDNCTYMFENTFFANGDPKVRNLYLETPVSYTTDKVVEACE